MLAGRTEEPDLLAALQGGADDYITKPFRPREMRARVAAMMRRPRSPNAEPAETSHPLLPAPLAVTGGPVLGHNGLTLNAKTRTVMLGGVPVQLTRSEFDLLHELLRASGTVISRPELVRAVRGRHYPKDAYISEADERAVEVHIGNLRRKLRDDPEIAALASDGPRRGLPAGRTADAGRTRLTPIRREGTTLVLDAGDTALAVHQPLPGRALKSEPGQRLHG